MSRMRTPSSALPAWPQGFVDGFGRPLETFAAFLTFFVVVVAALATRRLARKVVRLLDLAFVFLAIKRLLNIRSLSLVEQPQTRGRRRAPAGSLFLANHALRVEFADAAALGAGRRVDH